MVQLEILSGNTAGDKWSARRFPVRVGRSTGSDLRLEASGVWDNHFEIHMAPKEGFRLEAHPEALVVVNHEPVRQTFLRNGDEIQAGAVKLRFWLAAARQRGLGLREAFLWTLLAGVSIGQVALVYWLVQ